MNTSFRTEEALKLIQADWEKAFESLPGVSRLDPENLSEMQVLLQSCDQHDSYLTSPLYYGFTGRNGLWLFKFAETFCFICRHPNLPRNLIVFPQLHDCGVDIVLELLKIIPAPVAGLSVGRVERGSLFESSRRVADGRTIDLQRVQESYLDWMYPAHILSTKLTGEQKGSEFQQLRRVTRSVSALNCRIEPFDPVSHSRQMENLLHRWVARNARDPEEYASLYAPYEALFSLSLEKAASVNGLMIFVENQLQAIGLWDVSNSDRKTANMFINLCDVSISGLAHFLIVKSAQVLAEKGIDYINLGGSETEGLDTFKRRLRPVKSVAMDTIEISIRDQKPMASELPASVAA
jgi:hypothetical protein